MALGYNSTVGTSSACNMGTTASVSHTSAGSNRVAWVRVYADTNADPSSATYGGNAMTLVRKFILGTSSNTTLWVYKYVAPATSAQTVQVVWGTSQLWSIAVQTWNDVDQTTPNGTEAVAETNGAGSISQSVATTSGQKVLVFFLGGCSAASPDGGQTDRLNTNFGGDLGFRIFAASDKDASPSSTTAGYTITSASGRAGIILVPINPVAGGATPTVTDVDTDELVHAGQTGVVITGTGFGASQGAGSVKISPSNNVADGGAVTQTVTAWSDTSITITVVPGGLSLDTNLYLFVTNNDGNSNASGMVVQIQARAYVRETLIDLNGAAVASESGLTLLVWRTAAGPSTGSPNPDQALTVATNGSGEIDQVINRGSLASGDPVWIMLLKNGSPARATARKVTPVYE